MGNILGLSKSKKKALKAHKSIGSPTGAHSFPAISDVLTMPAEEELTRLFDELLDELNIASDKKELMRKFPADRKWIMVQAQKKEPVQKVSSTNYIQISEALQNGNPSTELLSELVVSLRTKPMSWISKFLENHGLTHLLNYLKTISDTRSKADHEELCVKCLKSLMNNKMGLESVLAHPESIFTVNCCIRSPLVRTKTLVLEMLAAVCLIPGGHKRVLEAATKFSNDFGERLRFEHVIYCLSADLALKGDEKLDKLIELQVSTLSFINAIICGGTGRDLDVRMSIRFEFVRLGIDKTISRISASENDFVQAHLHVYRSRADEDESIISKRFEGKLANLEDPEAIVKLFMSIFKNTKTFPAFASAMRNCLLIPSDPNRSRTYWLLVGDIIKQVALNGPNNSTEDNLGQSKINIDTSAILARLSNNEQVKDYEEKIKELAATTEKAQRELEEEREAHRAQVRSLEEALKKESNDLQVARDNFKKLNNKVTESIDTSSGQKTTRNESSIPTVPIAPAAPTNPATSVNSPPPPPPPPAPSSPKGNNGPPPPPPAPSSLKENNGPPPPPAPPFQTTGGPKPPPAPGLQSSVPILPPKACKKSSKPMKPLQWTKINNIEIANTVWKNLDDSETQRKLDFIEFEEFFASNQQSKREATAISPSTSMGTALGKELETGSFEKLAVLDNKRAQTINILIKSLKLSGKEIGNAFRDCNMEILKPHVIVELLKIIPTADEVHALEQISPENSESLELAEQFMWELTKIEKYSEKLKAFYVSSMFEEWYEDSKMRIKAWESACREVDTSKKLRAVLQIILALGNYMNTGQRGGAYGFKLDSLQKLAEVKSSVDNRKHTLMHYLVDLIDSRFPEANGWQGELKNIDAAAKIDVAVVRQTLMQMRTGVEEVRLFIDTLGETKSRFATVMKRWLEPANKKYSALDSQFKEVEQEFKAVVKLYGEEGNKSVQPQEFFGKFAIFINLYNIAITENQQFAQRQLENEKRERNRQSRMTLTRSRIIDPVSVSFSQVDSQTGATDKDGEFDNLISAIKSGQAFFNSNQGYNPQLRHKKSTRVTSDSRSQDQLNSIQRKTSTTHVSFDMIGKSNRIEK